TTSPMRTSGGSRPRAVVSTRSKARATSFMWIVRESCWTGSCTGFAEETSMAIREADLIRLREQVTATIRHGTGLLSDLKSLDDWLEALMPALSRVSESEREAFVARLCGYDASLPEQLRQLIEGLAALVGGLTTSDGAQRWVRQHVTRLESGDDSEAA